MGWEGTDMLTRGEHDSLWRNAFAVIPAIATSLRRSNGIECVKALHDVGQMSDDDFSNIMTYLLKAEGFTWEK